MEPSSSSILRSLLYFAVRSPRAGAPVLISPLPHPTERSAMVASSDSPDLWDTTTLYPLAKLMAAASPASVMVPIWLTFSRRALAAPHPIPRERRLELVTNRSSPTICTWLPIFLVSSAVVSKSSSKNGSSMLTIGWSLVSCT